MYVKKNEVWKMWIVISPLYNMRFLRINLYLSFKTTDMTQVESLNLSETLLCCFLLYKISHFSWQRSLIRHHIPQLKGKGRKSPYVAERDPVSHVKLKSTQTNIIEPLLEHERSTTSGWRCHRFMFPLLVPQGFRCFSSPPSIIHYFQTV